MHPKISKKIPITTKDKMLKPPNKGGTERLTTPAARPSGGNSYKPRVTTQAVTITKAASQQHSK